VILLEIRQGTYLLDGEPGLKQLGIGEPAVETIAADPKLQLLDEFMKEYGYEKTFENTKFIMFQANADLVYCSLNWSSTSLHSKCNMLRI
jgi:hypothetical protein